MMLRRRTGRTLLVLLALAALGCASANRLSGKSEKALAKGDFEGAYKQALKAVDKSRENPRARAAYTAAATRLVADRRQRILATAATDTLAAAGQVLALGELTGEIIDHGVALEPDAGFAASESAFRGAAAAYHYSAAEYALAGKAPKRAWYEFRTVQRYVPGYRDVRERMAQVHAEATARVAILPFADEVGVPGLSRMLADRTYAEVAPHARPGVFEFTRLVDQGQVYERITVAELDRIDRTEAVRIGRRLGADQVVTGRVYGLRTSTNTTDVHQIIYRKEAWRDTSGKWRDRYVETRFHAVERERRVSARYDIEVVDTVDESTLREYSDGVEGYARVVFTEFQAAGNCRDYVLYPPDLRQAEPGRVKEIETEWKQHFGTWTLVSLLEKARDDRSRTRYSASDRRSFFSDCHERPVWLGGLPGENDMASIALDVIWQPVLGMLRELDKGD